MGEILLERFSTKQEAILPIVLGWGKYKRRLIRANVGDGWHKFTLAETAEYQRRATLLEVERILEKEKTLTGYAYGEEVVPVSFENFFRRGMGETVRVFFLDQEPWTAVKIVQWEDGRFYYAGVDFSYHSHLGRLRKLFEAEKTLLGEKGVTPEQAYYYLLLSLERSTWRHLQELEKLKLSEREKKKRAEEFKLNFTERIQDAVRRAGGVFVSAARQANSKYLVVWKTGRQIVKSIIDDQLRIENAGYCLSGHDKEHSLHSIIGLAKIYQKESGSLYLTRL